ncbi:MAG: PEP-CTERM sorting domain-containing protein [bacterium]
MKFKLLVVLTALTMFFAVPMLQADVYYSHPYDWNSTNAFSSYYYDANSGGHQSFADYWWDGSFTMTDFHWWGTPWYENADIDGFVFQIYDQAAGAPLPGNLLYEQYVAGAAGATPTGDDVVGNPVYSYWLDLTTPFTLAGPQYLWFSVYAISDGDLVNWFWAMGDGDPFQEDWVYEGMSNWKHLSEIDPAADDGFAFEITGGCEVPEPGTLALFGIGLVGMAVRRFRRK